jgi:UDP-glucose-4-epimerase GalE
MNKLEPTSNHPAILVTGGAGYIGTQACKALKEANFFPIVYDNLSNGHREAVKWGVFEEGDIFDRKRVCEVVDKYHPVAVMHFAAFKSVGESVKEPAKYYLNNVGGSSVLLDVMREKKIDKIIFSSSAATYGQPTHSNPLKESDPCNPINPYGHSKRMVEIMLQDSDKAYGLKHVALRYFNVAGADLKGECGERGSKPINLVPIVLQVARGTRPSLDVFGQDYPTLDGTAVRDYLHVVDLADAHVKALNYLLKGNPSIILNLGTSKGASVQEVVNTARKITGLPISVNQAQRRDGDPAFLTADYTLAKQTLEWEPTHSALHKIVESEWNWFQAGQKN